MEVDLERVQHGDRPRGRSGKRDIAVDGVGQGGGAGTQTLSTEYANHGNRKHIHTPIRKQPRRKQKKAGKVASKGSRSKRGLPRRSLIERCLTNIRTSRPSLARSSGSYTALAASVAIYRERKKAGREKDDRRYSNNGKKK